ncbi:hypothetical protein H1W37_10365 [Stappia taiwanensis]|uniref:Uncharacterized protein n=1 Tax=Stappia taiwanensis TaxID=992267 RepID=A0A838XTT3_9HYPH|nr:hypothetical protein [Stappia taiwanensis]MBA4612058.1 hypothetical protein [Stappia taiwanensis]GGE91404.1 hypothetical protein GCM10007285_18800 [Stappia taiwanensis]
MLEAVVLVAEVGAFAWLVLFSVLLVSMAADSKWRPAPRLDRIGRSLVGNARAALTVGVVALAALAAHDFALF